MKTEDPEKPSDRPEAQAEQRPRRPYAPPAIEQDETLETVTLGTKPAKTPGHGC